MKKRMVPMALLMMFVFSMAVNAADATILRSPRVTPSLLFEGTTAYCKVSIASMSKEIDAKLTLWKGSELVKSWSGKATGVLSLSGNCAVKKGVSYTLKVEGTIGGKAFSGASVYGIC